MPIENRPSCNGRSGVTIHRPERCAAGHTLCWNHGAREARLIDMEGSPLHLWAYPGSSPWHHTELLENGHLLVVTAGQSGWSTEKNSSREIFELNPDSEIVWREPVHAHHDARRMANGNTLLVGHDRAHYPQISLRPLMYDYLEEVSPGHKVVWEWHMAAHVDELAALVPVAKHDWDGDWPHINTAESLPDTPLGRRDPRFRAGNILVSPRHLHCVFIIDRESAEIVWAWGPGEILGQHQPTMLENGHILLFDNGRGNRQEEDRQWSRVVELDPEAERIVWEYKADPPEDFWSPVGSGQQRLANGNTLICAMNFSETGRVFEVTPEREIVWEYWNPDKSSFYRAKRHPVTVVENLLKPGNE